MSPIFPIFSGYPMVFLTAHLALAVAIIAQRQHSALAAQQQRVLLAAGNRDEEGVAGQVTWRWGAQETRVGPEKEMD